MGYRSRLYNKLDEIFARLPFINPDRLSQLGVFLSVFSFLLRPSLYLSILLFVILFLDLLDGVMARRIGKKDVHIDLACDRTSELILFSSLGGWFILVVVINIWLSIYKLMKEVDAPFILPLRHMLLGYMVFNLFIKV